MDTLGPYELVRLIGRGGMGEVHLARDTRLEREVALKLLPADLVDDPDRRARFLREARAAAALNHPNITTIHDIGEEGGRTYLAQEFLDGRPLSEVIAERTLPLAELAALAMPLADALAYAHERGVIHRDLKADNVVVTSRGDPKILDFGLAKLLRETDDPGDKRSTTLTMVGAVFGTPGSMSPEQALGKAVDARSDVFSFGSLLYEMASGKPAFLGTTVQETMDKVLRAEPEPLQRLRRDLPSEFVAIVEKALRKDTAQRYQSMAEVAADLRHFKQKTDSGLVPPSAGRPAPRRGLKFAGAVLAIAALLLWATGVLSGDSPGAAIPRLTNPRQITSAVGWETSPSWSGQGGLIAYQGGSGAGGPGKVDVWVTQVGAGAPVNRTASVDGDCLFPSLSPDGSTIVFCVLASPQAVETGRSAVSVYTAPALAGPARMLFQSTVTHGPIPWSADGQRLALLARAAGQHWLIRVCTNSGETVREIPLQDYALLERADLAWSSDERLFAFQVTEDPLSSDTSQLWLLREQDKAYFPLTDGLSLAIGPSFSPDGRTLHYVSNQGGTMDLWQQQLDEDGRPVGEPVALTAGLGISAAAFSPDGRQLAYSKGGIVSNIWRAPLRTGKPARWSDAQQVTSNEARVEYAALSPDGKSLAVTSDRAGNDDIWIMPATGGAMRQFTTHASPDWYGQWSPDGEQLLFYSYRSGNRDLWMMPIAGGPARQLTDHPASDWFGKWSPDGSRIAFAHRGTAGGQLMITPMEPWDPKPAFTRTASVGFAPGGSIWVDDHTLIVSVDGNLALGSDAGEILQVYEGIPSPLSCLKVPGARAILFTRGEQVTFLDLDTRELRPVTEFAGRPGRIGNPFAADGEQVWFTWREERGDIWVMDVEGGG